MKNYVIDISGNDLRLMLDVHYALHKKRVNDLVKVNRKLQREKEQRTARN